MGNRIEEGLCIKCGTPLIELTPNAWHMCTTCTERTKKLVHDAVANRKMESKNQRHTLRVGALKRP